MKTPSLCIGIIHCGEVGNEPEAIRQTLEYFGFQSIVFTIGRPMDFIQLISGHHAMLNQCAHWIFCAHGKEGKFLLPEIDSSLYLPEEPRTPLDASYIEQYATFRQQLVLNTGCTLGSEQLAHAFIQKGIQHYIGTPAYPEGNAALLFVHRFYYELSKPSSIPESYQLAATQNEETQLFLHYSHQPV